MPKRKHEELEAHAKDDSIQKLAREVEKHRMQADREKNVRASAEAKASRRYESGQAKRQKIADLRKDFDASSAELIEKSMQGYDSFQSAMMSVVAHFRKFVKLMNEINLVPSAVNAILSWVPKYPLDYESFQKRADNEVKPVEDSEVTLPLLSQYVEFKDDHLVEDSLGKNLCFYDGKKLMDAQGDEAKLVASAERCFRAGIDAWLKDIHGYEKRPGTEPNTYYKDNGTPAGLKLTTETFEALRDDPNQGLNAFLQGYAGMVFEQKKAVEHAPDADENDADQSARPR